MNGLRWLAVGLSLLAVGIALGSLYIARKAQLHYEQVIADLNASEPPLRIQIPRIEGPAPDWWTEGPGPGEA